MIKFNKRVLKSGLIVLHEKRDVPVTSVMLVAKYGAAHENEKEKGMAHFIEHLCFKGTEKRSAKQIALELESVGGILNAFTSQEETGYFVKLPSKYLRLAIDVLFDVYFNPVFPEQEVRKEAGVILEEIKMYHDTPRLHALHEISSCLYDKPFGMHISGTEKNVKGFTREKLLKRHREVYVPKNSLLVVVGRNSFSEVLKLAEEFVVNRADERRKIPKLIPIRLLNKKITEKRKNLQQANLVIGFHFPFSSQKERFAGEVFSTILGKGMSSRLFTEIRENRGLAYAIFSAVETGKNYSHLVIYAGCEEKNAKKVSDLCLKEFEKMSGVSEKELQEGKEQLIGNYDVESEDSEDVAMHLAFEEILDGAKNYYNYKRYIKAVTLNDIKRLSRRKKHSVFLLQ